MDDGIDGWSEIEFWQNRWWDEIYEIDGMDGEIRDGEDRQMSDEIDGMDDGIDVGASVMSDGGMAWDFPWMATISVILDGRRPIWVDFGDYEGPSVEIWWRPKFEGPGQILDRGGQKFGQAEVEIWWSKIRWPKKFQNLG